VRKTDAVDAGKLARELAANKLKGIYVPSRVEQESRSLVRSRAGLVSKQTRCKNQIRAFVCLYGIEMDEEIDDRYWSRAYIGWLERLHLETDAGTTTLQTLIAELLFLRSQILTVTRRMRVLGQDPRYRESLRLLLSVPGIGFVSAMILLTELGDIGRFKNENRLACFVGLVPGEHSSGEKERSTGITSRRNRWLRHILIEAAWTASGKDTVLLKRFVTLKSRMPAQKAIVRIARNLLRRIWHVLVHRVPYRIATAQ
jgi:transposase